VEDALKFSDPRPIIRESMMLEAANVEVWYLSGSSMKISVK